MKTPSFIFNPDLCVHCHACAAACTWENKTEQSLPWRSIITSNAVDNPYVVSMNISMACNHCEDAACLKYCPANAYSFTNNGLVLIDQDKCMGCTYCQWVCPYEAPRLNSQQIIEKCTFCQHLIEKGMEPACTTACPTGALRFAWEEHKEEELPSFLPDVGISPRLHINESINERTKQVFTSNPVPKEVRANERAAVNISPLKEWGLVLFTFVATVLSGLLTASFVQPLAIPWWAFAISAAGAAILSMGHLGHISNAYRVFSNLKNSPLSREIAAYMTFSLFGGLSLIISSPPPWLQFLALVSALLLLLSIDQVYYMAEGSIRVLTHSAGSLLGGLTLLFFFAGAAYISLFFFGLKTVLFITRVFAHYKPWHAVLLFILRIGLLMAGLYLYFSDLYAGFAIAGVLSAEFVDRILFYSELKPLALSRHLTTFVQKVEKKVFKTII